MTSLSDTLTVGLVLVLLFGSIALYLYTRIQQAEQKISLLESILLDLKMSAEIKSYTELPADNTIQKSGEISTEQIETTYAPFDDNNIKNDDIQTDQLIGNVNSIKSGRSTPTVSEEVNDLPDIEVNQYKSVIADAVKIESEVKDTKVSNNYEAMTIKELQTLAKSRGITSASSMKKGTIIEALKTSDRSATNSIEPGSNASGTSSFLETSSPFQPVSESQ